MALTLTSPRLLSLGGQRGTGIAPDVRDVPGTKESVGSSWPRQLLFWRPAPLAKFVPPFPVIPKGVLQTPQLFLPKEVCEQLYLEISHLCVSHPYKLSLHSLFPKDRGRKHAWRGFQVLGFLVGTHHAEEAESCLELKNGLGTVAHGEGSNFSVDFPTTAWMDFEHVHFSMQSKY